MNTAAGAAEITRRTEMPAGIMDAVREQECKDRQTWNETRRFLMTVQLLQEQIIKEVAELSDAETILQKKLADYDTNYDDL